jgi:hypothetical protein
MLLLLIQIKINFLKYPAGNEAGQKVKPTVDFGNYRNMGRSGCGGVKVNGSYFSITE